MYVVAYETSFLKSKVFFSDMRCLVMFVTAVCLLFLLICSNVIFEVFGFTSRFLLHNSFSEFQ